MIEVAQGGTVRLRASYKAAGGALADPTTPLVDLLDPEGTLVISDAVPTREGLGEYYYDFTAPDDALLGDWGARWTGLIGSDTFEGEEVVTVLAPGEVVPASSWRPTVDDVAELLRARTKGGAAGVTEIGTFTDPTSSDEGTRPTASQVEGLIDNAVADVQSRVATNMPEEFAPQANHVACLRAANLVELSYFPEQTDDGRSVYQAYRLTYEEAVKDLARQGNWWALANPPDDDETS
jgi:hypothetical protein